MIVALDAHRSKCYHLGMGKNNRDHHSLVQIKIETIAYLRSSPSISLERQERDAIMTSLNLEAISMPSTPQPLTFVYLFSINLIGAYFVVRAKKNLQCKTIKWKRRLPKNVFRIARLNLLLTSLQTTI